MAEFMLHNGNHHKVDADERLYLHYPNTCSIHDISEEKSSKSAWAKRSTSIPELRLAPSRVGFVVINYETKGVITFFAQINLNRAAWQRIEWEPDFDRNWNEDKVKAAIENFLWVAMCEEANKILLKEWWL